jgi:FMN phosphatase YigB (HAD superfamily)
MSGKKERTLSLHSPDSMRSIVDKISLIQPSLVLCDFFDTVVTRTIEPEYGKAIWAQRIRLAFGLSTSSEDLHALRVELEAHICQLHLKQGYDDEFRFRQMARALYHRLPEFGELQNPLHEADFIEKCSDIEIHLECQTQRILHDVLLVLRELHRKRIRIAVVSDFFFTSRMLRQVIAHHHLTPLFSYVFLSSEPLLTKRSGRLYEYISKTLSFDSSRLVMLGDNPHSDVKVAEERGIKAFHIDRSSLHLKSLPSSTSVYSTQVESFLKGTSWHRTDIFPELGLSLALFYRRLFSRLTRVGSSHVLFLSREGVFMKVLFDEFQRLLYRVPRFTSSVVEISRRSSFLPSLKALEHESFETLFRQYRRLSIEMFLKNLSAPDSLIGAMKEEFGEWFSRCENDLPLSSLFTRLVSLPLFREWYDEARNNQKMLLLEYLSQCGGVGASSTPLVMVDVGWKGTIQDNLRTLLPPEIPLVGLYLGLVAAPLAGPRSMKEGMLFSAVPPVSSHHPVYLENVSLFEIMLSARRGSAASYQRDSSGSISVVRDHNEVEVNIFDTYIQSQQEAYKESFKVLSEFLLHVHIDDDRMIDSLCAQLYGRMAFLPSHQEVAFTQNISHYENFGLFDYTTFSKRKLSLPQRVHSVLSFAKAPRKALSCDPWCATAFHRLGLEHFQKVYGLKSLQALFGKDISWSHATLPPHRFTQMCYAILERNSLAKV